MQAVEVESCADPERIPGAVGVGIVGRAAARRIQAERPPSEATIEALDG